MFIHIPNPTLFRALWVPAKSNQYLHWLTFDSVSRLHILMRGQDEINSQRSSRLRFLQAKRGKRARALGKKEQKSRSGGGGGGKPLLLFFGSSRAYHAWFEGNGNDCNTGYEINNDSLQALPFPLSPAPRVSRAPDFPSPFPFLAPATQASFWVNMYC